MTVLGPERLHHHDRPIIPLYREAHSIHGVAGFHLLQNAGLDRGKPGGTVVVLRYAFEECASRHAPRVSMPARNAPPDSIRHRRQRAGNRPPQVPARVPLAQLPRVHSERAKTTLPEHNRVGTHGGSGNREGQGCRRTVTGAAPLSSLMGSCSASVIHSPLRRKFSRVIPENPAPLI